MSLPTSTAAPHGRRVGLAGWLLISPLLLWLAVFVVAPVVIMFIYSLCRPASLGGVDYEYSGDAYRQIVHWPLLKSLVRAAGVALAATAALVAMAHLIGGRWIAVADWLHRRRGRAALVLLVAIGWAFFRYDIISRVEARAGASLTEAQQAERAALTLIKVFVVSIDYALWSTAICVVVGYPVGYFIGRAAPRFRNALLLLVMIPFWTSFLIRTYAWVTILKTNGVLNATLQWLHIISQPLDLLPSGTAVMIGLVYTYLPFMILPIYTSCERLDQSLIEASFDLGANPFRAFWSVILPLT